MSVHREPTVSIKAANPAARPPFAPLSARPASYTVRLHRSLAAI
ncbi:MAG: hypothetical protein JWQ05_3753, partial [Methylobacterium sp.]|nr:hypothetical protein [Methylobacterium sp.]